MMLEATPMTWAKPTFEVIDLCSEVTSYLYKR
jgi:PqqA family